jgi:hypothetical protein
MNAGSRSCKQLEQGPLYWVFKTKYKLKQAVPQVVGWTVDKGEPVTASVTCLDVLGNDPSNHP